MGFRVFATVVLFVVAGLVAEGGARMLGPEVPAWQGTDSGGVVMVGHPTRLWGMGPGERQNAGTTATISKLGIRGDVPALPRPKGRERVIVLGDSSFFGHGVPDDATIAVQLGGLLRADGLDVDTVNAGIPGYSTEQMRLLLEEVGWGLEPTLLLVANLWSDNNFDHFRDADLLRTQRAFNGNPLARSAFFQLLAGAIDRMRGGDGGRIVTWTRKSEWPKDGQRRVPLQRYAENLDATIRDARARGVGVALLAPTNKDMAGGTVAPDVSWGPYFDAQAKVAAHHGVPRVETLPALQEAAASAGVEALFVDEMHPSAVGAGAIAAAIRAQLAAAGWPKERLLGKEEPFDASGLVDTPPEPGTDNQNPMSPQANLFRAGLSAPTNAANVQARDSHATGAGPASPPATPTAPTATVASPIASSPTTEGGWTVAGEVRAEKGPVRVEVRSADGISLGAAVLPVPGPFRVGIRPGFDEVTVIASTPAGQRVEGTAKKDGEAVTLSM
ncbi:MAG: SGNH/GDSL hydrolase family protein [Myxococcota bacterium]